MTMYNALRILKMYMLFLCTGMIIVKNVVSLPAGKIIR